jgi:hypothetical protein
MSFGDKEKIKAELSKEKNSHNTRFISSAVDLKALTRCWQNGTMA